MGTEFSLIAHDLHHSYGRRPEVLRGASLKVERGSILALLGLNGAGKTTLLRSLLGLVRPASGEIELLGQSLQGGQLSPDLMARIGYVPERASLFERMTAGNLIDFVRQVHPRWDESTVRRYLDIFSIPLGRRYRDLSSGTKAQLALTLAMAGRPELLILDEPTLGLDPLHRHQYLQLLLSEASEKGITVLLTSHDLYQIERVADTVAILRDGQIAVQAGLDELKERVKRVRVGAAEADAGLHEALAALPDVEKVTRETGGFLVSATRVSPEWLRRLHNLPGVAGVQVLDLSLEEVFLLYCEGESPVHQRKDT